MKKLIFMSIIVTLLCHLALAENLSLYLPEEAITSNMDGDACGRRVQKVADNWQSGTWWEASGTLPVWVCMDWTKAGPIEFIEVSQIKIYFAGGDLNAQDFKIKISTVAEPNIANSGDWTVIDDVTNFGNSDPGIYTYDFAEPTEITALVLEITDPAITGTTAQVKEIEVNGNYTLKTSYITDEAIAFSASGSQTGAEAGRAFDLNWGVSQPGPGTYWQSYSQLESWIFLQWGETVTIDKIDLRSLAWLSPTVCGADDFSTCIVDFQIQKLNSGGDPYNNSDWTTVNSVAGGLSAELYTFTPASPFTTQAIRVYVTEGGTAGYYAYIKSIDVYGSGAVAHNNIAPLNGRINSNGYQTWTTSVYKPEWVVDEDIFIGSQTWISSHKCTSPDEAWLYMRWSSDATVDRIVVWPYGSALWQGLSYNIQDFQLQKYTGTNGNYEDNANWTTINSVVDFNMVGDSYVFAPSTPIVMNALRIYVTKGDRQDDYATLREIRVYGTGGPFAYIPPEDCNRAKIEGYSLANDYNGDCEVNSKDFNMLAEVWLDCILPGMQGCSTPWEP